MKTNANGEVTVLPNPDRISAINNLNRPQNRTEAQSLLGYLNLLKPWIKDQSKETQVLRSLIRKRSVFQRTTEAEEEFTKIKQLVASCVELLTYDPARRLYLFVDTCYQGGFGFLLCQYSDNGSSE